MKFILFFLCCFFCLHPSFGQGDTLKTIDLSTFLKIVKEQHPLALALNNNIEISNRWVSASKGNFDPALIGAFDQKYFDGTTYYSTLSTGIKIPTRLGVDFKILSEFNQGTYINPEHKTPKDGITYLGFEIPLGRGLFADDRRTQLRLAQVAVKQTEIERLVLLNELLYEAGKAFISWQEEEELFKIAQEAYQFSVIRFSQTKQFALNGSRALIDTVEASAQLNQRLMELQNRKLMCLNARLLSEMYLWAEGLIPVQLTENIKVAPLNSLTPVLTNSELANANPTLLAAEIKINQLEIERKLKKELLKPQINLNYNMIQSNNNFFQTQLPWSNYKWGASLYFPILLRKERFGLQMTDLKINTVELNLQQKSRELDVKLKSAQNEWQQYFLQSNASRNAANQYRELVEAERTLFSLGESSLFIVNQREIIYLNAETKNIEVLAKINKAKLSTFYYIGNLIDF